MREPEGGQKQKSERSEDLHVGSCDVLDIEEADRSLVAERTDVMRRGLDYHRDCRMTLYSALRKEYTRWIGLGSLMLYHGNAIR